jgi:hypothetical protein
MVQAIQAILAPTNIISSYATPITVLPAPPAGFINNILGISHQTTGGTAYTTASKLLYSSNGTKFMEDDSILASTGVYNLPAIKSSATQTIFSTTQAVTVTTDAQAATGTSTINVYIIYEQIQIGV